MRLVLDTNVLLAAFISRGLCHDLLERCKSDHDIVVSDFILREFEEKLTGKFQVPKSKASEAVDLLRAASRYVEPGSLPERICRDPDDDWVLAAAVSGECRCIVTGDKDLLTLETFRGIRILSPRAFWTTQHW